MYPLVYFAVVILFWFLFSGAGLFAARCFSISFHSREDLFKSFWLGWLFTLFFLQVWHLFFPVNCYALVLVLFFSLTGFFLYRKEITLFISGKGRLFLLAAAGMGILLLPAMKWVMIWPLDYDTGLYHLQAIKWANSYHIVTGLANLHDRLAFSFSYFLYPALLNTINSQFYHFSSAILLTGFLAQAAVSCFRLYQQKTAVEFNHLFTVCLILPVTYFFYPPMVSSPTPNIAVGILQVLVSIEIAALIIDKNNRQDRLFYLIMLCLGIIAFKLSGLFFSLVSIILGWHIAGKVSRKTIIAAAAIFTLSLLRNIILSGYPFYPLRWFALPCDWRLPAGSANRSLLWVKAFARCPVIQEPTYELLYGWSWFKPWLKTFLDEFEKVVAPIMLFVAGLGMNMLIRIRNRDLSSRIYLFLLPALLSLVPWFMNAPSLRFAEALFIILAVGTVTIALYDLLVIGRVYYFKVVFLTYFLFSIFVFYPFIFSFSLKGTGWLDKIPEAKVQQVATKSGLGVNVPVTSDRCAQSQLPCAPYAHPDLAARCDDDLGCGFIVYPRDDNDDTAGLWPHQK